MTPLKRLLAATDFSSSARHAAERAALIARSLGAELDLLHVVSLAPLARLQRLVADIPQGIEQSLLDDAEDRLAKLAGNLRQQYGVAVNPRIASGALLEKLAAETEASAADLLVFGARGTGFLRRLLLGAMAMRMVSKTLRPILIVKQPVRQMYRAILVPVDFSRSSLPSIRTARATAPDAEIILLHAFEVPFESRLRFANVDQEVINHYRIAARQDAQEKMHALREQAGLSMDKTRFVILHGDASQHILEQEQELDCDLIVMGKHGENAVEELFLGSVTKRALAESQSDVLVSV